MSNAKPDPATSGAEESGSPGGADGGADPGLGLRVFAPDVQEAHRGAGREGGDRHRLDDRERVALEEDPVLERAGLRFVRVADHVVRLCRLGGDRRPLPSCRERRAAATDQLRGGDLGDDGVGADLERPSQPLVAAGGPVPVERARIDHADAAKQPQAGRDPGGAASRARGSPPARFEPRHDARRVDRCDADRDGVFTGGRHHRGRGEVAQPQAGDRSHPIRPSRAGSPAAPSARVRSSQILSAPASRQAMSSQTWATVGGRGVVANMRVEGGHAVRLGRGDGQPPADVVEGRLADPADARLQRMQRREQQRAAGPRRVAPGCCVPIDAGVAWPAHPARFRWPQDRVDRVAFHGRGQRPDDVEIHRGRV